MAASRVAPPTIYGQCISKIAWYVATFRATAAISSVESRPPRWQLGAEGSPGLQVAVSVVNRPASYTYIRVSYGTIGDKLHIAPKRTTSGTTKRMPQRDRQVQRDCDMRRGTARHYRDDVFVALGLSSLPARNSSSDISFSAIFGSLPRRLRQGVGTQQPSNWGDDQRGNRTAEYTDFHRPPPVCGALCGSSCSIVSSRPL
jgi:hypothetical protein